MTIRRFVGGAILAVWLVMAGWLVHREYMKPDLVRLAEAARTLSPGMSFYSLTMGEQAVGIASSRLDTLPDGFVLEDFMNLELQALGQRGTAVARTRVELSPALVMRSFSFRLDSEGARFAASGTVTGDTLLTVEVDAGGQGERVDFRLDQPPVFAAILPIRVATGSELEVGQNHRFPVFDPSTLSMRDVEVRILEHDTLTVPDSAAFDPATGRWTATRYDTIPAWRISERFGGMEVESWIDQDGRIVRASSPLGFSMERTEYELAQQALDDPTGLAGSPMDEDVILSTAIASNVDLGRVEAHEELRFHLSGVDLEGFSLDGGRQELRGDTLVVRREDWSGLEPGYTLPYPRMDHQDHLRSEPLIQADDEGIRRTAREMAGWRQGARLDPREVAARLNTRVYELLEKEITFSVPSAVQVLEDGKGDCNEHTVLYVALARAMGLPARTAVGLVYVDGSFFYHAWPEVWLGEWVAVDPTLGQMPASAAHIRFVTGGLAQQVEIIRLIGRLQIDVLPGPGGVEADL